MAKFHIVKASRMYLGYPYTGPTNDYKPAETDNFDDAKKLVAELTIKNPVGWRIYDTSNSKRKT